MSAKPKQDPFEWINRTYSLSIQKGSRVEYTGGDTAILGTVTGADSGHLMIRLDCAKFATPFHPTWKLRALDKPAA